MIKLLRFYFPAILLVLLVHLSAFAQNCTINAGADRTICPGSTFVLNGNATGLLTQQATWTQIAGQPVTISATTVNGGTASATVTGYTVGQSYSFRLSATCTDGTPVFDDAVYTVSPLTVANAGPDIVSCPGLNAVTMAANTPLAGETGIWSVNGNLPLPNPVTSPNGTISLPATGNTVGSSVYTWTITSNSGNCSSTYSVKVTNLGGEPIAVTTPVNVSCYSIKAAVGLHASFGGSGNGQIGTWSFISGPSTPTFGDIHDQNTGIGDLIGGTYIVRWTVTGPCFNGFKDVTVNVSPPSQDVTSAGGEPFFTYCDGRTNTALNGVKPLYKNEVVSWVSAATNPGGVVIANPTSPSTTISGLNGASAYDFIYTITNTVTNCSSVAIYHVRYTTAPFVGFITPNPSFLPCNATQLTVHYNAAGGNRSQWALVSAPPGSQLQANAGINTFTTAADDFQPFVGMNKIGTYVIRFRRYSDDASGGCNDSYADIRIVVSKAPYQANAGTSQFLSCNVTSATLAGNAPQGDDSGTGQWSQVSGPNNATIADKSLNTTGISNLVSGVYTFRWIVSGGSTDCGDSQSDVKVIVAAAPTHVNAGADMTVCYSTPIKLAADAPLPNEKGTWSVLSESPATPASTVTFSNVNDPNAIVTGLLANKIYTLQWTIENACGTLTDQVVINTNSTNGPKQAAAGPDQCLGGGSTIFNLSANAPDAGETGIWTLLPGSPNTPAFTNASSQTVTGATLGTYRFEWQLSKGGCATTRDTVVITISNGTTTAAINGSTGTSQQDVCGLGPVTLTATNAALTAGEAGTWTQTGGPGGAVITSPNGTSTTVTGLVEGRYKFRYTITNGACSSSFAEVTYNISAPPTPAVAAVGGTNPITLCNAASTVLDANTITVGTGLWVVQSGPNAPTFSSLNDPHATISGLILGTYVLTWQSSNGTICPASTSNVSIIVHQSANAGADQALCNTTVTVLSGNEGSDGVWTLVSALPGGTPPVTITKNGSSTGFGNTAIVTGLTPNSNYVFRYTINTGLVAGKDAGGCGTLTDDMAVAVSGPPSTADAGPDQQLCTSSGTSVTLAAATPTVGTGTWSIISRPLGSLATLSSTTAPNATFNNLSVQGDYLLQWTVTNANCTGNESSNDIVRISVFAPPTVAGPMTDQPAACLGNVTLTGTTPTVGIGTWTFVPNGPGDTRTPIIDAPNAPTTSVSGLVINAANPYKFRWTITNGTCTASSADVNITVKDNTPAVANAGTVANTCAPAAGSTASVTLASTNTTLTGNDQGTWTVVTQPPFSPAVTFDNLHSATATASNLKAGAYTLRWTIANNSACTSTSDVSFTIFDPPSTADAGPPAANYCLSAPAVLSATAPTSGTGTWTVLSKPTGAADPVFSSVNDNHASVSGLVAGAYTFRWTVSTGQCTDSHDDITITVANCVIDLGITNTDGKTNYTPGTINTYTIVASNNGTSDANGATVTFPFPTGVTGTWTATYTGTASGTASGTTAINEIVNLPVGSSVTYVVTANIGSGVTGNLTTIASVNPPPGLTDVTPGDNSASDTDTQISQVDLNITNTDGKTTYTPGTTNTYTVVATNTGLSTATGALVSYPLPAGVSGTWTAVYAGGATGNASGTGNINETVTIPPGGTVTYTVAAAIASNVTGDVTTTATITAPAGITDPTPANNVASYSNTQSSSADLSVTNSDGKTTYTPGTANTYTIVVTNSGPSDVTGATVTNNLPAGVTGTWTAVYAGGATGAASGTGNIGQLVNVPAGGTVTYTYVVTIPSDFTAASLNNTTTVTMPTGVNDPTPVNNTATDGDTPNSITDLKVVKTASGLTPSIGTRITFTVAVSNNGPSMATNVSVSDLLPSGFTYVSATPDAGTYNNTMGVWAIGNLANAGTQTLTITASVNTTGSYTNTATVTGTEADSDPTNNSSQVTIAPKQLPVANNDAATTGSNTPVAINLLTNDVKAADNLVPNTVTIITPPQHGTVTVDPATGIATYTATPGYSGTDTFTYTVTDANGGTSNIATATITVDKAPVANDDNAITAMNTPVIINLPVNDVNGDAALAPSTVIIVQQPLHGTVTVNTITGTATYTPNAGYFGQDNFTYTIKDQNGFVSNVANVTVTIPKGPTAVNDNVTTTPNRPVGIPVINNDQAGSADLDPTTITIITQPAHGTLIVDPVTGLVTYTPALNYAGPDQFTYTIRDKNGAVSNVATVTINTNDRPVIGLAKAATAAVKAVNGSFDVTYILTVGNYGITDLNNISIKDDLTSTFRGEQWVVKSIRTLGKLTVNNSYNGNGNTEMLASANQLFVGQVEEIELVVNVTVLSGGTTYQNRATASGTSITGTSTTDQSTDGLKPDVTTAGDVSSSVPTPVELKRPNEFIPQGFSPNGDGVHDTFVIENVSGRRVSLEFYNRWGNLVYRNGDYKNDWGGKCNQGIHIGEDLPEGTYYYIVKFDDKDRYVGYITLNR
ncbi:Ig-like domain-containing protein [Mucilaginibacter polytrichastri]|uniref:DUF11 domain-containing protein n=1 Tax=Mucilaginibacter polytrichastri TaxID=1302689 RepID=A0A1Q6A0M0_9SPHI|nr:Ig-like domain-containing protein [Mucilaginibacter polytrichastri]OKS87531.1 hypothetical protein RG47T_2992 [Mucilaginibacter polytrichastri]SFS91794.1 conserved repeat domain-containing protein/gliding motility-associated C-terminal domain-containing protein [Mucilaginibacter polytrichastri]